MRSGQIRFPLRRAIQVRGPIERETLLFVVLKAACAGAVRRYARAPADLEG
jgi:hypothetical protein